MSLPRSGGGRRHHLAKAVARPLGNGGDLLDYLEGDRAPV